MSTIRDNLTDTHKYDWQMLNLKFAVLYLVWYYHVHTLYNKRQTLLIKSSTKIVLLTFKGWPACTPVTARAKRRPLVTSRRPPGSAGAQPSGREERCTEATPTSPQLGSTEDARTTPVEHFHSEEENPHTHTLNLTLMRPNMPICLVNVVPYPCNDGGEQLQKWGESFQLSLGDAP